MTVLNGNKDKILGCMFGGAAGDALGYPVEFDSEQNIFSKYGDEGISEYELDPVSHKALISDDTQMTLFTANGLLAGESAGKMWRTHWKPRNAVAAAYRDWLATQKYASHGILPEEDEIDNNTCWLCYVPELYAWRAPGHTCLTALETRGPEIDKIEDFIADPINESKGCGGVMRVAPLALKFHGNVRWLASEAAQIAAITHSHSLGYIPAAMLVYIINRITYPDSEMSLKEIVLEARNAMKDMYSDDENISYFLELIDRSVTLAENEESDLDNIHQLGQGWVGEEALAISLYCSLRYTDDFSKAISVAVNHNGDSDSTGAITGNIVGSWVGYDRIEDKWINNLELKEVILELANDLYEGCQMSASSSFYDMEWERKYSENRWK